MFTGDDRQPGTEAEVGPEDRPQAEGQDAEAAEEFADAPVDEDRAEQPQTEQTQAAEAEQASSEEAEPSPDEQAAAEAMDVDVYGLLRLFVSMMTEQAWIHLGLQTAPGKTETETRLSEARVAIDTLQFLRKQLDQNLQDVERRELDRVISTLRVNYIQRT